MTDDSEVRFGGVTRLFGAVAAERLRRAHICVVGMGGVGSWTVEALARSGVGQFTLVDLDDVCVSNVNRQLHALEGTVGRPKVEVMAERVRSINPRCGVRPLSMFFTDATTETILDTRYDYVVDAIDRVANKCRLLGGCRERSLPVVTFGGAGGRRDALGTRIEDMALTSHDRLLQKVRVRLRQLHGFPRGEQLFGVECVYSPEPPVFPQPDGSVCARRDPAADLKLDCNSGLGTAAFVTGTFGFVAAGLVVRRIAERE